VAHSVQTVKFAPFKVSYLLTLPGKATNSWRCQKTVNPGVNLWSRSLIH